MLFTILKGFFHNIKHQKSRYFSKVVHVIESWKLKTQDQEDQYFCHFLGINIVIFHLRYDTCSYTYINWEMSERFGAHKPCMRFFQQGSLGTGNFWIVWIQKCGHKHSFAWEYLQEKIFFRWFSILGFSEEGRKVARSPRRGSLIMKVGDCYHKCFNFLLFF